MTRNLRRECRLLASKLESVFVPRFFILVCKITSWMQYDLENVVEQEAQSSLLLLFCLQNKLIGAFKPKVPSSSYSFDEYPSLG